ncbi:MAG TPA: hypothetical protein VGB85_15320 [Nannocystis sp.]|jgi:hypothetical protein
MAYLERLEAMAAELARHPLIEVLEHAVGSPYQADPVIARRHEAYIETQLRDRPLMQEARRDPSLRAFYKELGWYRLVWRLHRDRLDPARHAWAFACEDGDWQLEGHINILEEVDVFEPQEGMIWFAEDPPEDPLRTIYPLDRPHVQRATVLVPGPTGLELALYLPASRDLGSVRLRFDAWFDRLLATRGMVDTMWSSPGPDFERLRSVFPDVDPRPFA